MSRIVVGLDGSGHAARALQCALTEARLREATLDLVHAVPEPYLMGDAMLVPLPSHDELRAEAVAVIANVLAQVDVGDVRTESIGAVGSAASVLCETAKGAELLVVGSRGLGGFRGLLLGSVTQQVVAHSPCPILVVVPEDH